MANCPICETEYTENEVETCAVCGYDLTPLWFLDKPPDVFLEKERKRIAAAKRVWQQSQCQLQSAQKMVSQFQSQLDGIVERIDRLNKEQNQQQLQNLQLQLDEMNRKIDGLTESQNQRQADFQSQLDGIVERIDHLNKGQNQQQLQNLQSQLNKINRKIGNLSRSQSQQETQIIRDS
ncbi:MAG: hypothetical protein ACP5D7_21320 [Limnospira sp.]